jgi:hypothetical protein
MTRPVPEPDGVAVATVLRSALAGQYHAALAMLRQAIDLCPDALWSERGSRPPFWRVAYHTLYYAHLYLQPGETSFRPWELHRTGIQDLDDVPAPPHLQELLELPHRPPQTGAPYTKGEVLAYLGICDRMVEGALEALDVLAPETGFSWHSPQRSRVEQQVDNVRHIQHHATQLADRVRAVTGARVDWVGSLHPERPGEDDA